MLYFMLLFCRKLGKISAPHGTGRVGDRWRQHQAKVPATSKALSTVVILPVVIVWSGVYPSVIERDIVGVIGRIASGSSCYVWMLRRALKLTREQLAVASCTRRLTQFLYY